MIMLPGAAKNAPSMTWIAMLTASLAYLNHTCCKFGNLCPTWRIFGSAVPAAPTWRCSGSAIMTVQLGVFRQHCLASIKAIKEPQVSHTKIKK